MMLLVAAPQRSDDNVAAVGTWQLTAYKTDGAASSPNVDTSSCLAYPAAEADPVIVPSQTPGYVLPERSQRLSHGAPTEHLEKKVPRGHAVEPPLSRRVFPA